MQNFLDLTPVNDGMYSFIRVVVLPIHLTMSDYTIYRRILTLSKANKIFGVGLKGAGIGLMSLLIAFLIDKELDGLIIMNCAIFLIFVGVVFITLGIALHLWTAWTLRNWWIKDKFCIGVPFKYFRNPMYAAWITFISFGAAFLLSSAFHLSVLYAEYCVCPISRKIEDFWHKSPSGHCR
jgi:protein-S-isoprenylcysteine O-methyltransferase Ste14